MAILMIFFTFLAYRIGSQQMEQIMEVSRGKMLAYTIGELLGLTNEVNHSVLQHAQVHDHMRSTMDTAFNHMSPITHGFDECNVPDRQLYGAYTTPTRRRMVTCMVVVQTSCLRSFTMMMTCGE